MMHRGRTDLWFTVRNMRRVTTDE